MGSKAPAPQPAVTTQISKTELPKFVEEGGQKNYEFAQDISKNLAPSYLSTGANTVAGMNGDQEAAFTMARMSPLISQPAMQTALGTLGNLQGYGGQNVQAAQTGLPNFIRPQQIGSQNVQSQNAGWNAVSAPGSSYQNVQGSNIGATNTGTSTWAGADQNAYINPYKSNVLDSGLAAIEKQRVQANNATGDQAAMAGAFGGGRHGVMEGVNNANAAIGAGQLTAQVNADAYNQGRTAWQADTDRQLTSDTNNANRWLQADQSNQQNALQAGLANQQTGFQQSTNDANRSLQAQLANQQTGYQASAGNADRATNTATANANRWLTSQQSNQAAGLDAQKTNAQNWMTTSTNNADRDLTAQRSNQTTGLTAAQLQADAAAKALQGGQLANQTWLQSAAGIQSVGDTQRQYEQDLLNQEAARYDAGRNAELEKLGILQSALSMTPYGTQTSGTTISSQPRQQSNGLMSTLGGIGSIASAFGPLLMSDERTKKNKRKIARDPITGVNIYSYSYNDENEKRIGPMAGEVEKAHPGSTFKGKDGIRRIPAAVADTPMQNELRAITGGKGPRPVGLGIIPGAKGLLSDESTKTSAKPPKGKKVRRAA